MNAHTGRSRTRPARREPDPAGAATKDELLDKQG
jgi:hypothetical protein